MKMTLPELIIYMDNQFEDWYQHLPEEIKNKNYRRIFKDAFNCGCTVTSKYLSESLSNNIEKERKI